MKVLVTGDTGMVGTNLLKLCPNFISWTNFCKNNQPWHYGLRIDDYTSIDLANYLHKQNITHIIHLAAHVGGIQDNASRQYEYFINNVNINSLIVDAAIKSKCKLLALSSTCAYPEKVPIDCYPMVESMVHDGPPEQTNFSYGYSKRMMDVQIEAARKECDLQSTIIYSANLFGQFDKFNSDKAHFIPSTISKFRNGDKQIKLFGDGSTLRQFTYVNDLCRFIRDFIEIDDYSELRINFANPENITIAQAAMALLFIFGNEEQEIVYTCDNTLRGQSRRDVYIGKLQSWYKKHFGEEFMFTDFRTGLELTKDWLNNV